MYDECKVSVNTAIQVLKGYNMMLTHLAPPPPASLAGMKSPSTHSASSYLKIVYLAVLIGCLEAFDVYFSVLIGCLECLFLPFHSRC